MKILGLWLTLWFSTAAAAPRGNAVQARHAATADGGQTRYSMAWKAPPKGRDEVQALLSTAEIEADKSVKRMVQLVDLHAAMAAAARASAKDRGRVKVMAKGTKEGVQLRVTGAPSKKAAKAALAGAQRAMSAAQAAWMKDNRVMEVQPGVLSYDHALVVAERARAVAPLAAALREGTTTDRAFVARALSFVQAIPYQRGKRGKDAGFQHPLALLTRNKGDCDGKAALFLALLRAELPELPIAMVYVPGHALVGVGLPSRQGDATFKHNGKVFVFAEPVGPAAHPLGSADKKSRKSARRGQVRSVPR